MMIASVATVTGLLLISVHNVWVQDWPVIITLVGWILFLKGSWFMLFPDKAIAHAKTWNKEHYYKIGGLTIAIIGAFLSLVAF